MKEDDISRIMAEVWKAFGDEDADARDEVIFELYRQRSKMREALERIAAYPYHGWTQQVAETTLIAITNPAAAKVTLLGKAIEKSVNRGLATTALKSLPAGAEMMCKEGVPFDVSKRVLLHPDARRATDWQRPETVASIHPERKRPTPTV